MATVKTLELEKIIEVNRKLQKEKLKNQWTKDIEDSNKIISQLKDGTEYIEKNEEEVNRIIERLNKEIDYYSELGIQLEEDDKNYKFSEIRRNLEKNYRILSLEFYKYNFNKIKIQNITSKEKLDELIQKQSVVESKMQNVDSRVEGLGATFLNMVLTISIITTMVTILLNTTAYYSIVIVLSCAWLLLSSILFIGIYFKKTKSIAEIGWFVIIIYSVITLLTFSTLIYGVCSKIDIEKKKDKCDEQLVENNYVIENNNEEYTDNKNTELSLQDVEKDK